VTTVPRPKAYSYIRFSTPEQAEGDSLRRQTEVAREYAARHKLDLDEELTFRDLGVSAYRRRNVAKGALGDFLVAVREGRVEQGAFLLVEALDRVSRQAPWDAAETMRDIVREGVNVVDLSDNGRVYNTENLRADPMAFLMMVVRFMRAHEESLTKSRRVADAYERKRADAANGVSGEPFTRMLPAWLRWDKDAREHVAIRERAAIIRDIFESAAAGTGQHSIAHRLNAKGVETWGTGKRKAARWHRSYVRKILTNSAVVGTFTPHRALKDDTGKRVRKPQEPIENYWPAVVDRELFERVSARIGATAPRGRNAGRAPVSIFAGVLKCAHCGDTAIRITKGAHKYLVCSKAHARGDCKRQAVRYADVESALCENIDAVIEDAPRGHDTTELEMHIAGWEEAVSEIGVAARALAEELARERSEAVRRALQDKDREWERAQETLRDLKARRDTLTSTYVLRRLNTLRDSLQREPLSVVDANNALKEAVSKVVLNPEAGRLIIYWRHADEPSEGVAFQSRHSTTFDKVGE
jgi:DNA invertase Pin-like site-specific DNA recombinase